MSESSSTNRCQQCNDLELDDRLWGGREVQSVDGQRYVELDFDRNRPGPESWPRHVGFLPLDHAMEDSLPALPNLAASSRKGCKFCSFLKDLLQSSEVLHLFEDLIPGYKEAESLLFDMDFCYAWNSSKTRKLPDTDSQEHNFSLRCLVVSLSFRRQDLHNNAYKEEHAACEIRCRVQPLEGKGKFKNHQQCESINFF